MNIASARTGVEHAPLIEVSGLAKRYGSVVAVHSIDMTVRRGEFVTLIGPNGAGKTTLVRMLLGLERPSAGRVARRAGLRIGYVPQRIHVDETLPLTVHRFLRLSKAPPAAIDAVLHEVGASHIARAPFQSISGGETRRILLARALLRKPELLVLDEPTAGVDVAGQTELYNLINRVRHARGCGVLLVSHDLHVVMAATDRVLCLNHHLCCSGTPEAVSTDPEYLALFGPDGARTLAVYMHEHDHVHDVSGDVVPIDRDRA